MAKVKIQGHASGSGVLTITAPNTSTDRTITLPDATATIATTAATDALTTRINAGGRKNLIINGDMQVAQRATTSTATGYKTVDRWQMGANVGVTQSHLALTSGAAYDAGFRSAFKLTNTGAIDTTASQYVSCFQNIEAQDLAKSGWTYKSSSSSITISFWIKSSVAGTYYVNPMSQDGTKKVYPQSFSLNANTWTKVEKTYVGLSSLTFANDTGNGMQLHISPFYGTNFTASSVSTSAWSDYGSATRFPDFAQNWGASTGATWEITGVQLELGSVATNFEHRSYGEELALCQRYYQFYNGNYQIHAGRTISSNRIDLSYTFPTQMRAAPSLEAHDLSSVYFDGGTAFNPSNPTVSLVHGTVDGFMIRRACSESVGANLVASHQVNFLRFSSEI